MRFRKAWDTYEKVVEEYYAWKPRDFNFDDNDEHLTQEPVQLELDFGDEEAERRMDIIGSNGNIGYKGTK
jgi:hypothetical protein